MDGSNEHPLRVGEYTMYFCSEDCKQAFREGIPKSVLGMKLGTTDASDSP
jgi:YHS domain-containing protein